MTDEQRVAALAEEHGLTMSHVNTGTSEWEAGDGTRLPQYDYKVTLRMEGRRATFAFHKGAGHNGAPPTLGEVLECLLSDANGVQHNPYFEDWAGEYGYDTDSRKAQSAYNATVRQTEKLRQLLGDQYEAFLWGENQ